MTIAVDLGRKATKQTNKIDYGDKIDRIVNFLFLLFCNIVIAFDFCKNFFQLNISLEVMDRVSPIFVNALILARSGLGLLPAIFFAYL